MRLFIFLLVIALNGSCQQSESTHRVSADSLKAILAGEHGMLIDVRTPEEFAEGHIPGAVNIDYHNEGFSSALDSLDKNKEYEIYCRSGNRSGKALDEMQKKGFKNVYHLEGGILMWNEKGYETVK